MINKIIKKQYNDRIMNEMELLSVEWLADEHES